MAITINNFANITYKYGNITDGALSNIATTQLVETVSLNAVKTSNNSSWRPSENITYMIRVSNDGTDPLFGVSIQDDLGGETTSPLTYVTGTTRMLRNSVLTEVTPTNTSPLTIIIPNTLEPGEVIVFTYIAKVRADIDTTKTEITNIATVVGHETSIACPTVTVTPSPTLSLTKSNYADVRITKNVNKDNVSVGDELTYTFLLENFGNIDATNIIIRDNLPTNFTVNEISSVTNGVTISFEATDYSIDTQNKLIIPTSTTKTISVPASTNLGSGKTTVTITGTIND